MEKHLAIASKFEIAGTITQIKPLGPGFINDTFIVTTQEGPRFILQRKNVLSVYDDCAISGAIQATKHMQKSRFTRTRGAYYSNKLTFFNLQIYTIQSSYRCLSRTIYFFLIHHIPVFLLLNSKCHHWEWTN